MSSYQTKVGIVFGGKSQEHLVSIESARTIFHALNKPPNSNLYKVVSTYIDNEGNFWPEEISERVLIEGKDFLDGENLNYSDKKGLYNLFNISKSIDIWFPVLHGPNGEDGTIQGLFKLTGKPFVGSGVLGSAMGMDKIAMKTVFNASGLPQVPYIVASERELLESKYYSSLLKEITTNLGFPCFIKPANLGSSVGITKANSEEELREGLKLASTLDKRIVIEKNVNARELECGVIGLKNMQASTVGEVTYKSDWYDYETKYAKESSKVFIPAKIPKVVLEKIQELSIRACKSINAEGIARVDFFYEEIKNKLWINEINTMPGFTNRSMYPMLWDFSGLSLEKLVAKLVETARE